MNHTITTISEPGLFCKPSFTMASAGKPDPSCLGMTTLFSKGFSELRGSISFRSLNLKEDLPIIHNWVQQDYTLEYWQMNGHFSQLFSMYQCMALNPYSHSFIGCLSSTSSPKSISPKREGDLNSSGNIICQFDVYSVFADELREHVPFETHDCGFHLLMAPNEDPIAGLTVFVIKSFLEFYFSFPEAKRMYAEPDVNNLKSIALLERCGFKKIKRVQMSYKVADVYVKERE